MKNDLVRTVISSVDKEGKSIGHIEKRTAEDGVWSKVLRSDFIQYPVPFFAHGPLAIMQEIGLTVSRERANEFAAACDSDFGSYYYLGVASSNNAGDEALKWIMGSLAAELNATKKPFSALGELMKASVLNDFVCALTDGRIDRSFSKAIFAELLKKDRELAEIITDPLYKAADESAIDSTLDRIISENPEQFEKAKVDPKVIQWFVGQMMKAMQGKAKPPMVIAKMQERLS